MSKVDAGAMTRRGAISSMAALGAGGALAKLKRGTAGRSTDPLPHQLSEFTDYENDSRPGQWKNIPWGLAWGVKKWTEPYYRKPEPNQDELRPLFAVLDIDIPTNPNLTRPAAGWPVLVYYHATGPTKSVMAGSPFDDNVRSRALAAGFVFVAVEFRHPQAMSAQIAPPLALPHTDVGLSIQYIRGLHAAFDLDRDHINVICFSRGNLAVWQSMQPDLADLTAPTYEQRQSSRIQAIWSISGQVTYSSNQWADLFVNEGDDRDEYKDCYYDDYRLGSALNDLNQLVDTTYVPPLAMVHDRPYFPPPGTVSLNTMKTMCDNRHFPNNGLVMRNAYIAKGLRDRIITWDRETDEAEQQRDCIIWFQAIAQGATAPEAWAIARASRLGHQLFYVRTPYDSLRGVASNTSGAGIPALPVGAAEGGEVGAVVDGSTGLSGRVQLNWNPLNAAKQGLTNNKPHLKIFPLTGRYGLAFQNNDRLTVSVGNASGPQSCVCWTEQQEYTGPVSVNTTQYQFGEFSGQTMSLAVGCGAPVGIGTNDLKGYRQFANAMAGSTHSNAEETQNGSNCPATPCTIPSV